MVQKENFELVKIIDFKYVVGSRKMDFQIENSEPF